MAGAVTPGFSEGSKAEYQFESYKEESGRIEILSHYFDFSQMLNSETTLQARYVVDGITGATPVGTYDSTDHNKWDYAEIDDERRAYTLAVNQDLGDQEVHLEYNRSKETDYISDTFALTGKAELNEKNTILSSGISYANDTVVATSHTALKDSRKKESVDVGLGVSQLLSKNSFIDVNATYGHTQGYQADPYRRISYTGTISIDTPFGPLPITDTFSYPENRPYERNKFAITVASRNFIEQANASLIGSYRFYTDDWGIMAHTLDLTWKQQLGEKWILSPFVRLYDQSAADFYYPSLTKAGFAGHDKNDGTGAKYSADYRLAALQSLTYGLTVEYQVNENLGISAKAERYQMYGKGDATPSELFPDANVIGVGANYHF